MFFNQDSTCVLKAKLANSVATSQLGISVTYKDNTGIYHQDAVVATNNTTAVTLLDAPSSGTVNIVELIKIYNPDTQSNTVQILKDNTVIFTCTVGANQSVVLSEQSISNGLGYIPANADLNNLTSDGKSKVSNLAMPSNSYMNLTLGASGSSYILPADGYVMLQKNSTAANQYVAVTNITNGMRCGMQNGYSPGVAYCMNALAFGKQGDTICIEYTAVGSTITFEFIYAQGEV